MRSTEPRATTTSVRAADLEQRLEEYRRSLEELSSFALPEDLAPPEQRRLEAKLRSVHHQLRQTAANLGIEVGGTDNPSPSIEQDLHHDGPPAGTEPAPQDAGGIERAGSQQSSQLATEAVSGHIADASRGEPAGPSGPCSPEKSSTVLRQAVNVKDAQEDLQGPVRGGPRTDPLPEAAWLRSAEDRPSCGLVEEDCEPGSSRDGVLTERRQRAGHEQARPLPRTNKTTGRQGPHGDSNSSGDSPARL